MTPKSALAGRHGGAAGDDQTCPLCGSRFTCGMAAGQAHCWCADLPVVKVPDGAPEGCFCPDCLRKLSENTPFSP